MRTEVDERALRETTDAAVWAKAFLEVIDQPDVEVDFGLMVGWFANAIETAKMAQAKASVRERDRLRGALQAIAAGDVDWGVPTERYAERVLNG